MAATPNNLRKWVNFALSLFFLGAVSLLLLSLATHESPRKLALAAEKAIASAAPSPTASAKPSATPNPAPAPSATATPSAKASTSSNPKPAAVQAPVAATPPSPAAVIPSVPVQASAGAIFPDGIGGNHTCSASVVASPGGNVIVTAAHCLSGSAVGVVFAPGYASGQAPYGLWTVTAAYVAPGWLSAQNTNEDYAFLTVAPMAGNPNQLPIQQVVGGLPLGGAPAAGTAVTVTGYATGLNDAPIVCSSATYDTGNASGAVPTFTCGSFPGGTSGGRWDANGVLVGVIGGLHQGGCTNPTSYSAPFDATTASVLARAASGAPADSLPEPGSDGC